MRVIKSAVLTVAMMFSGLGQADEFNVDMGLNTGLMNNLGLNLDVSYGNLAWHNFAGAGLFGALWLEAGSYLAYQVEFSNSRLLFGPGINVYSAECLCLQAAIYTGPTYPNEYYGLGGTIKYAHEMLEIGDLQFEWTTAASVQWHQNFHNAVDTGVSGKWTLGLQARF